MRHLGVVPLFRPGVREAAGPLERGDMIDRLKTGTVYRSLVLQQKLNHAREYLQFVLVQAGNTKIGERSGARRRGEGLGLERCITIIPQECFHGSTQYT